MRQFQLIIRSKDDMDLVKFCEDLNGFLMKFDCVGCLNELINPLILDDKNNTIGYE